MARDGYPYIAAGSGAGILLSVIGIVLHSTVVLTGAGLCAVITVFFAFFFRDPERVSRAGPEDIISPADGYIVAVEDENETGFFNAKVKRVSIFLTVFDVHINRIPIGGTVEFLRYITGSFKAAFMEEASQKNEQTAIGIACDGRRILFKQIAGVIARRIVCTVKEGQTVTRGERCGMIKFGSRVDVLMPLNTLLLIKKGQKVYGGITVIGRFTHEE